MKKTETKEIYICDKCGAKDIMPYRLSTGTVDEHIRIDISFQRVNRSGQRSECDLCENCFNFHVDQLYHRKNSNSQLED